MKRRARPWLAVQTVVTGGLLAWLASSLDLRALGAVFAVIPAWFYAVSLAVVLAGQLAYAWRWQVLLSAAGVRVRFADVARHSFVAIFVNNFLPSTVGGDVAKVYYVGRDHGYRTVMASVAIDRLLGVGLLAALAALAFWAGVPRTPRLVAAQAACAAIALAALAMLVLTSRGTGGLARRVAWLGDRAVGVADRLQRLRLDMAAPLASGAVAAKAAAVVIVYAAAVTTVYQRFVGLYGPAVPPFMAMFAVVTAAVVLSNVPVSLNGVGLREQLHASLLAPLGVQAEIAVAISLLLYAHLLLASVIGLVLWLRAPVSAANLAGINETLIDPSREPHPTGPPSAWRR